MSIFLAGENMDTKLIVALDTNNYIQAKHIIDELSPLVDTFKVGSILYTAEGIKVIEYIHSLNKSVFLDLKFFDIPNTIKGVSFVACQLKVKMFTFHLLGGREMIRALLMGIKECMSICPVKNMPIALGVTILTSMNERILHNEMKIDLKLKDMTKHLARMGYSEGIRGFVCSPVEVTLLRKELGNDIILATPGIRLNKDAAYDQKRVMTPLEAKKNGANFIIMGRSITDKKDMPRTVQSVLRELSG
jgi:orotidine-5'-phosphate decarboxylase